MIVLIAGMPRSGSTFSFNVAREALMLTGKVFQEPSDDLVSAIKRTDDANHLLLKSHIFDDLALHLGKLGAVKIICTLRKPEDAVASLMTIFDFTLAHAIGDVRRWLEVTKDFLPYTLLQPYDLIDHDPRSAVEQIARYIDATVDDDAIDAISAKYSKLAVKSYADALREDDESIQKLPSTYYNTSTFFHRRHVSSLESIQAVERIGQRSVDTIRSELGDYIDAEGDLLAPFVNRPVQSSPPGSVSA